jgi:hypothetical protein
MPNVPPQPNPGMGPFDTPVSAPATPPPVGGAAASWLPPTVPVQPSNQGAGGAQPTQDPQANVSAPAIADDGDVIEKEWVDRAKQIVARTRQDPYNQTRELHKFKAEYLQKRYNKTIEAVQE